MPFVDLTTITVTGECLASDQTVAPGIATFEMPPELGALIDAAGRQVVVKKKRTVWLDETGRFAIDLPATTDPDIQPSGWSYTVTVALRGADPYRFNMIVPYDAGGGTVDIADNGIVVSPTPFVTEIFGGLPAGGREGQLPDKLSDTDFDFGWVDGVPLARIGQSPPQTPVQGARTPQVGVGGAAAVVDHDHAYPVIRGTGDPNGVVTAPNNWLFIRTDGVTATTRWYCNVGGGTVWAHATLSA